MKQKLKRLTVLGLIAFCACQKVPDLSIDDGVPAAPEAVRDAVVAAWGPENFDGSQIHPKEIAWFSKSVQLFNTIPREFEQQMFSVLAVDTATPGKRIVHIAVSKKELPDPNNEKPVLTQTFEYPFEITAPNPTANDFSPSEGVPEPISFYNFVIYATACIPNAEIDWTPYCYNLKTWQSVEKIPDGKNNGCPGLTDCKANIKHVAYDLVTEIKDLETGTRTRQKNKIHLKFTQDLPYLSRLVSLCFQGMGTYNKEPYLATVCTDVLDYDPDGPDSP